MQIVSKQKSVWLFTLGKVRKQDALFSATIAGAVTYDPSADGDLGVDD